MYIYAHINDICRRAHFHLRNIGNNRMLLSFEATSQLIHALITTTVDYRRVSRGGGGGGVPRGLAPPRN